MSAQTRRKFLKSTMGATAASLLMTVNESQAFLPEKIKPRAGFQLLFMQTDWGFEGSREEFCAAAKREGYEGIEVWWPGEENAIKELFDAIKKHGLEIGFLCGGSGNNIEEHLKTFKKNLDAICANNYKKPLYINCHSGKDFFTYEENKQILDYTTAKKKSSGIPIYHETHRSRMMFAAPVAQNFAQRNPEIRFTLDISHWCNVHESLLADQTDTIDYILDKTDHIHCRIGHPQGPQVNDPRAPEWAKTVAAHLAWWDKVIANKKRNGERITVLTEFGPADYMPTLPYTKQPLADQWAINVYMMTLLRKRYQ